MPDTPTPRSPSRHEPVAETIARARTFFGALQADADLAAALADYGYDADAVTDALALAAEVEAAERTQKTEYAEQYEATRTVARLTEAFRVPYMRHVRLARVLFPAGTLGHDALGLAGERAERLATLVAQANAFYHTARDDARFATDLARLRITPAEADAQIGRIAALQAALTTQQVETGEAQQATRTRDAAVERLRSLLSDATEVAKVALADVPQIRERLGLVER